MSATPHELYWFVTNLAGSRPVLLLDDPQRRTPIRRRWLLLHPLEDALTLVVAVQARRSGRRQGAARRVRLRPEHAGDPPLLSGPLRAPTA